MQGIKKPIMKLNLRKARRLTTNGTLGKRELSWEFPKDLLRYAKRNNDGSYDKHDIIVSMGMFRNNKKPHLLILNRGEFVYLEKTILDKINIALNSGKEGDKSGN